LGDSLLNRFKRLFFQQMRHLPHRVCGIRRTPSSFPGRPEGPGVVEGAAKGENGANGQSRSSSNKLA
jgi:hypothetical protein